MGDFTMHGLILRTLQRFLWDTYGPEVWCDIARASDLRFSEFEAMLTYDAALFGDVLCAMEKELGRKRETILEDVGTYLVSHTNNERLRRLLRFGGNDFIDFLHSLDDLPGRTKLAVPDLILPELELNENGKNEFTLSVCGPIAGFAHVLVGVLRAMADDYGALVLLEFEGTIQDCETITMSVVEADYAEGREFLLAAPMQRTGVSS